MSQTPINAILPRHSQINQWVAMCESLISRRFHSVRLIKRNAYPDYSFIFCPQPDEASNRSINETHFVVSRALTIQHSNRYERWWSAPDMQFAGTLGASNHRRAISQ